MLRARGSLCGKDVQKKITESGKVEHKGLVEALHDDDRQTSERPGMVLECGLLVASGLK